HVAVHSVLPTLDRRADPESPRVPPTDHREVVPRDRVEQGVGQFDHRLLPEVCGRRQPFRPHLRPRLPLLPDHERFDRLGRP
ncbi:hypothetical protein ABTN09_21060, partial [Acinetobacter baumannii]